MNLNWSKVALSNMSLLKESLLLALHSFRVIVGEGEPKIVRLEPDLIRNNSPLQLKTPSEADENDKLNPDAKRRKVEDTN